MVSLFDIVNHNNYGNLHLFSTSQFLKQFSLHYLIRTSQQKLEDAPLAETMVFVSTQLQEAWRLRREGTPGGKPAANIWAGGGHPLLPFCHSGVWGCSLDSVCRNVTSALFSHFAEQRNQSQVGPPHSRPGRPPWIFLPHRLTLFSRLVLLFAKRDAKSAIIPAVSGVCSKNVQLGSTRKADGDLSN